MIAGFLAQVEQPGTLPAPSINAGGVLNAASYAPAVAPGSIAAAFGGFLVAQPYTDSNLPLLSNVSGFFSQFETALTSTDGPPVPLFFVSSGQINFQVPWELQGQSQAGLAASLNATNGIPQDVTLSQFAPGIFSMNSKGTGQGAVLDTSYRLVDSSNPATAGSSYVFIYCTGLGPVANQPATGFPASNTTLSRTTTTPTVTIGGAPATVQFSGLAPGYVGLYQVNAQVPAASAKGAEVPVVITMGTASNTVTIAVQ